MVRCLLIMLNVQEINGGQVTQTEERTVLTLPPVENGYTNAQIDDYAGLRRRSYLHRPTRHLSLRASFNHTVGTAGFGFWNAPYGDPATRTPALPKAVWFFSATEPNHLPFLHGQTGFFAATIDVKPQHALLAPLALANWLSGVEPRLWPKLTRLLGIRFARVGVASAETHHYTINWQPDKTTFAVDGRIVLTTSVSPNRPLGFVAWVDNQHLIATPKGRFGAGISPVEHSQQMILEQLTIS